VAVAPVEAVRPAAPRAAERVSNHGETSLAPAGVTWIPSANRTTLPSTVVAKWPPGSSFAPSSATTTRPCEVAAT